MIKVTITTKFKGVEEFTLHNMDAALDLIQQRGDIYRLISSHIEEIAEEEAQPTKKVLTPEQEQINELYKKHKKLEKYNATQTEKALTPATFKAHVNVNYHNAVCHYLKYTKKIPTSEQLRAMYKEQQHSMFLLYRSMDIYVPLNKKKSEQ